VQANRRNRKIRVITMMVLAMALVCSSGISQIANPAYASQSGGASAGSGSQPAQSATGSGSATQSGKSLIQIDEFEPFYADVMAGWLQKGYKDATATVRIPGTQISAQSEYNLAAPGSYQGKNNVLIWKSDRTNWIEYKVNIAQDGFYQMNLLYHPYNDPASTSLNRRPVVLAAQIDGAFPYREARAMSFTRLFKDELPVKKDKNGDDIRPRPLEISGWSNEPFRDQYGAYTEPLKWYFTRGEHTIRLSGYEPVVIEALELVPPTQPESYEKVAAKYPSAQTTSTEVITLQAEEMTAKNDVAIQMAVDKDPFSYPKAGRYETFNTVGGTRWQNGNQTITWKFTVPESGRYKIALRAKQSFVSNLTSFRTIMIDGKVPFSELLAYRFPYIPKWVGVTLQDDEGKPFEFYLEKGEHTLSMSVTIAPFQPVIIQTDLVTTLLREVDQELKAMTGGVVDKNRTWKVDEEFPELPEKLQRIHDELAKAADEMLKANGRRDNTVQTLQTAMQDIRDFLKYPNEIPYHMEDIATMQEKIGSIRETLIKSPLQLDQIYIVPSNASMPKMEAGFFQKLQGTIVNFFYSFIRKDDLSNLDENALNVWVNRGRDYVNLLQELADELFTPQYGIPVKVNLLPNENLLIYANAAGLNPDVALGQPQDKSTDFAMRNALLDLTTFPDFWDVAKQFAPGALLPFYYNGGYYALPETQSFKVLFYRKDILSRLGLGIPETWEDVYEMMPTLQQNGYNFYVPHTDFITFIYQNGAEFFTPDGMKTALDSPEAFRGFKHWTDLFNIYDVEKNVPSFYQHFRKGTMPIGIADYNTYVTLSVAAPELTGWWGVAPLPGIRQPDGTIVRWSAGGQTTGFIYKSSKKKEEAWTFLKWLVSADVQERYGMDLESFNGIQFRWNTANIEAFTRLPWPKDDLQTILEQWRWYKEMPNLPGSYFVSRELNNAWNRTVVDGMNYRESLEEAVVNINREMMRKEQEFGFVDAEGNVLHTLDLPQVKTPWEGVDRFVTK